MGPTSHYPKEALDWLRYILDAETAMPAVTDWPALLDFAEKQALTGVFSPATRPENLPKELQLRWISRLQWIERENNLQIRRAEQLFERLEQEGFRCCLLKGLGNAILYPDPMKRSPGDIDLWLDTDEATAYRYVKKLFPEEKESFKHIHFPLFEDVSVDVHVTPLKLFSGIHSRRLQQWIERNKAEQFENRIRLPGASRDICVPTGRFNAVYQLGHMLVHTFDEGLGLRQVVDYYYVLKNLPVPSKEERDEWVGTIKTLGMIKFAAAVMWMERDVLGLPAERCLVEPDRRRGEQLLRDMLAGGNFGRYSRRYGGRGGFFSRGLAETWRDIRLLPLAPREGAARVCWKFRTAVKHILRIDNH